MQDDKTATFTSYIPKGFWVNLNDFSVLDMTTASGQSTFQTTSADEYAIAHLGQGAIIPWNDNSVPAGKTLRPYNSAQDVLAAQSVTLLAHMSDSFSASGSIYLDSGDTPQPSYTYLNFELQAGQDIGGSVKVYKRADGFHDILFEKLIIVRADPIDQVDFACIRNLVDPSAEVVVDQQTISVSVKYDATVKTLTFTPSAPVTLKDFDVLYFGTEGSDFNFCSDTSFQYNVGTPTTVRTGVTQKPLKQLDQFLPDITVTEYLPATGGQARFNYELVQTGTLFTSHKWPTPLENPLGLNIPADLKATKEEIANGKPSANPSNALYGFDYKINTNTVVSTSGLPFTMARQFNRLTMNIFPSDLTSEDAQVWGLGEQVTDQYFL